MNRAERRRRTSLIVAERQWSAIDGPFGLLLHPAEFGFFGTWEEYEKELEKYNIKRRKIIGQCRAKHPFDCGRAKCGVCHMHKHPRIRSLKEIKADIDFREQLEFLEELN